jgi:hypothetical protein
MQLQGSVAAHRLVGFSARQLMQLRGRAEPIRLRMVDFTATQVMRLSGSVSTAIQRVFSASQAMRLSGSAVFSKLVLKSFSAHQVMRLIGRVTAYDIYTGRAPAERTFKMERGEREFVMER